MKEDHLNSHLVCNARSPLISNGKLREELILYAIRPEQVGPLIRDFAAISGKQIDPDADVSALSGGQKVLLMVLLALNSPARSILFLDLWHSLDEQNQSRIKKLLDESNADKEIKLRDSSDED
ncbi:MAG: hypothetical protein ACP5F3_06630 [Candidatus Syntrophosphaera sp.]